MSVEIPQPYLDKIAQVIFQGFVTANLTDQTDWETANDTVKNMCKTLANELCQTYFLTRRDGQMEVYG